MHSKLRFESCLMSDIVTPGARPCKPQSQNPSARWVHTQVRPLCAALAAGSCGFVHKVLVLWQVLREHTGTTSIKDLSDMMLFFSERCQHHASVPGRCCGSTRARSASRTCRT